MPQGDDFVTSSDALAPEPVVDEMPPAAPAPESDDPAASAPAPDAPPVAVETPEQTQAKQDRAFAKMRRERDAALAKNAALEAQRPPPSPAQPQALPPDPTAPLPDAYATHHEFVQATAAHEAQKAVQAYVQRQADQAAQTTWNTRQEAVRATHDDYDEVIDALETPFHEAVLQAIQTSDQGAEVAYHLASHPEEAARLGALPPAQALRELGKIEARLEAAAPNPSPPTTPTPTVPKPRPLTPVGPGGAGADTRPMDTLPYDEYVARYIKTYGTR